MQKIKMARGTTLTFEEGCNKYMENCRQRNLREGTIEHYRQSYVQFYKFFDPKMPIEDIDEQLYRIPFRDQKHRDRAFPCQVPQGTPLRQANNEAQASYSL